jgi:hypothetical protein
MVLQNATNALVNSLYELLNLISVLKNQANELMNLSN